MKIICLEDHTTSCRTIKPSASDMFSVAFKPPLRYLIIQYEYRFGCIIYCSCLERYDHLSFKEKILNTLSEKHKKYKKVQRGVTLKEALKEKDISILFKYPITEVHYQYTNAAGKEYGFTTTRKYSDYLPLSIMYSDNYRNAIKTLKESKIIPKFFKESIEDELWSLYRENDYSPIDELSDLQVIKLTDLLMKNNLKQIV